jgi:Protein of unknown function (DUF732)
VPCTSWVARSASRPTAWSNNPARSRASEGSSAHTNDGSMGSGMSAAASSDGQMNTSTPPVLSIHTSPGWPSGVWMPPIRVNVGGVHPGNGTTLSGFSAMVFIVHFAPMLLRPNTPARHEKWRTCSPSTNITDQRNTKLKTILHGLAALVAAGVIVVSPAGANPYAGPRTGGGDAEFLYLAKLHIAGLSNPTEDDAGLTGLGKAICHDLDGGRSRESVRLQFIQGHGWSDSDASWMVTSAVVAYCPMYIIPSDRW